MDNNKNVIVTSEEIGKQIEKLLHTRFGVSENFTAESSDGDDAFFGLRSLLEPRELTYLAFMLETRYGIRFGMDEYDDPKFYCVRGLSEIVAEMVAGNCDTGQ